jgi:hypothetical protein
LKTRSPPSFAESNQPGATPGTSRAIPEFMKSPFAATIFSSGLPIRVDLRSSAAKLFPKKSVFAKRT